MAQPNIRIAHQPDDTTCGPTCLHAVYRYFGDGIELSSVVSEVQALSSGGTLGVMLASHALRRGYQARIYTYNLQTFDPTWFDADTDLPAKLRAQHDIKRGPRIAAATQGYLEFLDRGGQVRFEDLTASLLLRYLSASVPILTGLSATYLYRSMREHGPDDEPDDVRGEPAGHFVVLSGFDEAQRSVAVADPYLHNPGDSHHYAVSVERLICAILLGVLTHDANLLMLLPKDAAWP